MNMDRSPLEYGPSRHQSAIGGRRMAQNIRDRAVRGYSHLQTALDPEDLRINRLAKASRILGHSVHDGPQVGRRLTNDTEDLTRSRLLLQGLLRLVEQADVLDRDDRLVSECLEQGNLVLGEAPRLGAAEADRAKRNTFPHQGNTQ